MMVPSCASDGPRGRWRRNIRNVPTSLSVGAQRQLGPGSRGVGGHAPSAWSAVRARTAEASLRQPRGSSMLTSRYVMQDVMQVTRAEPQEHGPAASMEDTQTQASAARPTASPRRRLNPDQAGEVARLYAEGSVSTAEIRARFGIGESSLYRILQRQGIPLRGRAAVSEGAGPASEQGSRRRRWRRSGAAQERGGAAGRSSRGRTRGGVRPGAAGPTGAAAARNSGVRGRFRVQFVGETIVEAQDIRDALRQAESLGATEITAVTREA